MKLLFFVSLFVCALSFVFSPMAMAGEAVQADNPCAVYTSQRGKDLCEQQMQKRERMQNAKESRSQALKESRDRLMSHDTRYRPKPEPTEDSQLTEEEKEAQAAQEELKTMIQEAVKEAGSATAAEQTAEPVDNAVPQSRAPDLPAVSPPPVESERPDMDKIAEELKKLQ